VIAASAIASASAYEVTAWSFPSGGGTSSSGPFRVIGTPGEPLAGTCSGGTYALCNGFWWVVAQGGALTPIDPDAPGQTNGPLSSVPAARFSAPNPTSGTLAVTVSLPSPRAVERILYDVSGRELARIQHGVLPAGVHRLGWELLREKRSIAAGVYYETVLLEHRVFARRSVVFAP